MDAGAANVIVQGFLKGAYDVLEALLGSPFAYNTDEISEIEAGALSPVLDELTVGLRAEISGGGGVALLMNSSDAAKIVARMEGPDATPKDAIEDQDMATLKEVANSVLGGGISNLSDKFGDELRLENIDAVVSDSAGAESLFGAIAPGTIARYTFESEDAFPGSPAAFLFSSSLESRVPNELVDSIFGDAEDGDADPVVSEEEIQDILSGFDSGTAAGPVDRGDADNLLDHLNVVMDIELVATVRLGVIEMPLSDVLNLGPGSIVDVDQLVDDPVELLVNGRLVARGDVVVVDEKFGLRVTEIISQRERIESLR